MCGLKTASETSYRDFMLALRESNFQWLFLCKKKKTKQNKTKNKQTNLFNGDSEEIFHFLKLCTIRYM